MAFGVDYAFYPHPSISALKSSGAKFIGRYVSPQKINDSNGKNLIPSECKALLDAGFELILYAEQYAARMKEGRSSGIDDAKHFDAVTKALKLDGIVMYGAADWDATPAEQAGINAYLDGVASIIGRDRTGIYGGYYPVKRALDAGKASHAVQTLAWSGGQWDSRVGVRQYLGVKVGGVIVDRLTSMKDDFGQYPRPKVSTGPYRHQIGRNNTISMYELAQRRHTTIEYLTKVSLTRLNAANRAILESYLALDKALVAAKHPHPVMPDGLVYWTSNP